MEEDEGDLWELEPLLFSQAQEKGGFFMLFVKSEGCCLFGDDRVQTGVGAVTERFV